MGSCGTCVCGVWFVVLVGCERAAFIAADGSAAVGYTAVRGMRAVWSGLFGHDGCLIEWSQVLTGRIPSSV